MLQLTITFGLHLDGQRATIPTNSLGKITTGPLGLLALIETQLGLLAEYPSQAERIVQYRDCLKQADNASRFYHQTFAIDPLGTAETLLAWRDAWHLHGWDGQAPASGKRLADVAAVEIFAQKTVAPSLGERLTQVIQMLGQRKLAIDSVNLVDPLSAFPKLWQELLTLLPVYETSQSKSQGIGFLGTLQISLENSVLNRESSKLTWEEDGTVSVVQAETRYLSGAWVASHVNEHPSSLFIATSEATRLDASLVSANHPRLGLRQTSVFRPTLQVLPLALEIIWDPLDFTALVKFLTHPVCPVPGYACRKLAKKLAEAPGVDGTRWEKVLTEITGIEERINEKDAGKSHAPSVLNKINLWVKHPRYAVDAGAPIAAVLERVECLTEFFRARLRDEDEAIRVAFHAGFSQCHACAEALRLLMAKGETIIRPRQLQKLVSQATAHGIDNPLLFAEVGAQRVINHPGAAVDVADQVIWWQLTMPNLPPAYPWSAAEIKALKEVGVQLPSMEELLTQAAQEWLRPILSAREKLVLVLPPKGEEVHPLWQMIKAIVKAPCIQSLEQLLTKSTSVTRAIQHQPLPALRRWWQLPSDVLVPTIDKASFSSLELMLFNPYHWLLKYPAKLKPSEIVSMGDDFRLFGNLAHGLVERFCLHPQALTFSDTDFDTWFTVAFTQLISEEGAVLLMAGQGSKLERFRSQLYQSMRRLRQHIAKAGIKSIKAEIELNGHFEGCDLSGYADLVMQNAQDKFAIVDMKWAGPKKYSEKLKNNSHLQLAIYAKLLQQTHQDWPAIAYYILGPARLLAPDQTQFPSAEAIPSQSVENTAQLWERFIKTWRWRKTQISKGNIEVALECIEQSDESTPPDDAMQMEYLNEAYNDYRALAGWDN